MELLTYFNVCKEISKSSGAASWRVIPIHSIQAWSRDENQWLERASMPLEWPYN